MKGKVSPIISNSQILEGRPTVLRIGKIPVSSAPGRGESGFFNWRIVKCNKVALGHHKDDIIETLLLNIFYSGEISTMLPLQSLFKGKITIIRPLSLVEEKKIERFAREMDLPFGPSGCPSSGKTKRKEVKEIIEALSKKNHRVKGNIFRSLSNIKLDYTLERVEKKSKRRLKFLKMQMLPSIHLFA